MIADPHAVQISVDGSCFPNEERRSGYAGVDSKWFCSPAKIGSVLEGLRNPIRQRFVIETDACRVFARVLCGFSQVLMSFFKNYIGRSFKKNCPICQAFRDGKL